MLVLRVVVLVSALFSVRGGEMCATSVTAAPGDDGKLLSAKAFAEFAAKCRQDRSKVTLKSVATSQPFVTTKLPSTTTLVPSSTTKLPSTTSKLPSTTTKLPSTTTLLPSTTTELPSTTTEIFTTSLTPCAMKYTTSSDTPRIPENRFFASYPVVLLFTLLNDKSNLIELRFMDAGESKLYEIQVRRGSDESTVESEGTVFNHEFDASIVFRMTYSNGEITLGVEGQSQPSITYKDSSSSSNDVKFIELYSKTKTQTEWTFYRTCSPTFLD